MAKYVMVVQSAAKEGRDDEYNTWYDTIHLREICSVPGVTGGRRLSATPIAMPTAGAKYITLYEIETDDIGAFMAEMGRRSASGEQTPSDSLDKSSAVLWIYADMAADTAGAA